MKRLVVHRNFAVFGVACALFASIFLLLQSVNADAWSWTTGAPKISVESDRSTAGATPGGNLQTCQPTTATSKDAIPTIGACTYQARSFQLIFYTYCESSWSGSCSSSAQGMGIKFPGDSDFHRINNMGGGASSWRVSPQSDSVLYNGWNSTYVVNDLPSHLTRTTVGLQNQFTLDTNAQRYLYVDENGTLINTGGIYGMGRSAMSMDGRWAVLELENNGLVRVDLSNYTYKLLTKDVMRYGGGMDPTYLFAITNDGRFIATGGMNINPSLYDADSNCGETSSVGIKMSWIRSDAPIQTCPSRSYAADIVQAANNVSNRVTSTDSLSFNDDGGELELIATTISGNSNAVKQWYKLTAANYTGPAPLDYLALGDSISSGEGDTAINPVTKQKYYRTYTDVEEDKSTNQPREKCHLSTRSYPYLLATWMNLGQSNWNSIACSGASVSDISDTGTYDGQAQGGPFPWSDGGKPRLEGYSNESSLQLSALSSFIPGRDRQIEFVKKYKPKVITITIGANDFDFASKLQSCLLNLGTCDWATSKKSSLATMIQDQYDKLVQRYKQIYDASGGESKIYVIGYPRLISDAEPAKCDLNVGSLDSAERSLIVQATNYLNSVIEHAANAVGVQYLDVSDSLIGGRLCDDGQKYVNGISFTGTNEIQESFHPNDYGHIKMTEKIESDINKESLLTHSICTGGTILCPKTDNSASKPEIPSYFGGQNNVRSSNLHTTTTSAVKGANVRINLNEYQSLPGGSWQATLHSDPIDLGTYTANNDGSLSANITIPASIPVGYHILTLVGQTYSGDPIEYAQDIFIQGSNPNDIDENGTLDSRQPCGPFTLPANIDIDKDGIDDACDPSIGQAPSPSPTPAPSPSPTPSPTPTPPQIHKPSPFMIMLSVIIKNIVKIIHHIISLLQRLFRF
jgi:lysophospholipase L1-like esterase